MGKLISAARIHGSRNGNDTAAVENSSSSVESFIYLLGRPTLSGFLRFAQGEDVDKAMLDPKALREEWLAAQSHIQELEKSEAGCANGAAIGELPKELQPLRRKVEADPVFQKSFDTLPTKIGMVELDRLVVYQKHVNLDHAGRLKAKLGPTPALDEIFRTTLPYHHPQPPAQWMKTHGNGYVFVSPSDDMRFLGPVILKPSEVSSPKLHGSIVGIVGLMVGFGSNFLNVIQVKDRMILNNGSHRAYALRDLGIKHVPAIIQQVESTEDLKIAASSEVRNNPEQFVDAPRPSMLKDYFNPKLRKIVVMPRQLREIRIEFETQEVFVPSI